MATIRSTWGNIYLAGEEQLIDQWSVNETVRRTIQISIGFRTIRPPIPTTMDEVVVELDPEQAIKMGRALLAYGFGGKKCVEDRGDYGQPMFVTNEAEPKLGCDKHHHLLCSECEPKCKYCGDEGYCEECGVDHDERE